MTSPLRLFVIAGEPSGDALGAALMKGLRQLAPSIEFKGIGGELMQAEGLTSLFPMSDLSVMGIAEVLPRLPRVLARIRQTAQAVEEFAPAALITIDSPDFCLRVAKRIRKHSQIPVIHYVAPSVWAWRPGRARKMARVVDHVLALLPFEPPYMEAAGMSCDFVGHPIAGEALAGAEDIEVLNAELDLDPSDRVLLLLPGSRSGEVRRMLPLELETVSHLKNHFPDLRIVIPTVSHLVPLVREILSDNRVKALIIDPSRYSLEHAQHLKKAAFIRADVALATSGTVSLEISAAGLPMVIAYRANWLTELLIKRLSRIDTATLANIVTGRKAIPEFLFEKCDPQAIAGELERLLKEPERADAQRQVSSDALDALGRGGEAPGLRAAKSVLNFVNR